MKERPILFTAESVHGIIEERKTQTRRAISGHFVIDQGKSWPRKAHLLDALICPYGRLGDRLWVREKWRVPGDSSLTGLCSTSTCIGPRDCEFAADFNEEEIKVRNWRSSMFMPRWASRLALEITKVRVERVQDISEEDALAEGCSVHPVTQMELDNMLISDESPHVKALAKALGVGEFTAKLDFRMLWDNINAKRDGGIYAWDRNPWTWVIEFKRL